MDFYEEASLVMVPSGYKDQKVYSSVPDDGSGDLTFSRASTATRVNSDGYIEKAQVNLLLQSNTFSTIWGNSNTTETGGQADKDGGNTAWKLDKSAASGYIIQSLSITGVHTFSVYAKAGTLDWIRLNINLTTGTDPIVYFNLSNGTIGSTPVGQIDAKIQSVGGGWYRCSVTANGIIQDVRFFPADGDNDVSGTSGNIYIQDAQLNYGLVAQDYVETTTASVTEGVAIDVPRLNYDPVNPTSASLLLEPSRTNLLAFSEYFEGSGWNLTNATIANNTLTSPEGTQNASTFTTSVAGADLRDATNVTGTYTFSVFAKLGDVGGIRLRIDAATDANAFFDLTDGSLDTIDGTNAVADLVDYGNGWYRCYLTADVVNTQKIQIFTTDGTTSYANGSVYLYGAQFEAGSYPTSYIPTYGSSATRTADDMDTTFASAFATDGGATLFYEIDGTPPSGTNATGAHYAIYFSSNDYISYNRSGGGIHRVRVNANSVANYFQTGVDSTDTVKICASVTASNATVYANGVLVNSVSITGSWASATNLVTTINDIIGSIPVKQLILFPTALTATQLAELTTL